MMKVDFKLLIEVPCTNHLTSRYSKMLILSFPSVCVISCCCLYCVYYRILCYIFILLFFFGCHKELDNKVTNITLPTERKCIVIPVEIHKHQ